ncbi:hypothetical protein PanNE5_26490 [Pandoraea sp. NE5]|nr:hypothetical protein PanNE5_26490 [Pandoraea sp. NE5]
MDRQIFGADFDDRHLFDFAHGVRTVMGIRTIGDCMAGAKDEAVARTLTKSRYCKAATALCGWLAAPAAATLASSCHRRSPAWRVRDTSSVALAKTPGYALSTW